MLENSRNEEFWTKVNLEIKESLRKVRINKLRNRLANNLQTLSDKRPLQIWDLNGNDI